ncbi:MAG: glycoside hydrolase family 127 protein [Tannerellaceae bacterium]|nr:glycoside hydrolase family 127 protein [Tannerellaceae bacterium]
MSSMCHPFISHAGNGRPLNNRQPLIPKPYLELPLGEIKPQGWLLEILKRQRSGMSSQLDVLYPEVMGPRNGWLGGDGDQWERGPYWIDGLLPLAYILDDKELKQKVQPWVEWALASQREDGFFGPSKNYPAEKGLQRNNSEDWWPRMVVLKFMKQYYSATGDERVIHFMTEYFHYQLKTLPEKPLGHWTFWAEYRACDNLQLVYWLYNITGDFFLLELGELLHKQSYDYTDMFLNRDDLTRINTIHCVNLAQGIKEPLIYYQQNPDEKYRHAVKKAFRDIRQFHGQPQGMYGGDEALHGNNPTQGTELCAVAELMFSLEEMSQITGDVQFPDHLERIAFNALPTQIGDDFMTRQYFQQPNQVMITREIRNFDINHGETDLLYGLLTGYPCCTSNLHQAWPKFAQNLWYMTADSGIAALTYSPSEVHTNIRGVGIRIKENTYYPMDDKITFTFDFAGKKVKGLAFPFHLRIPAWCKSGRVFINGELYNEYQGNTIAVIDRVWKNNDTVVLELPMHIQTQTWYENSVSVERGPLVYALKIKERWVNKTFEDTGSIYGKHYYEVWPESKWNYGLVDFTNKNPDDIFEVIINKEKMSQPYFWNPENAPVEIKASAKEIPSWILYNGSAGPLPYSRMIYGPGTKNLPEQKIILIPYGCTTLRISEFPLIKD